MANKDEGRVLKLPTVDDLPFKSTKRNSQPPKTRIKISKDPHESETFKVLRYDSGSDQHGGYYYDDISSLDSEAGPSIREILHQRHLPSAISLPRHRKKTALFKTTKRFKSDECITKSGTGSDNSDICSIFSELQIESEPDLTKLNQGKEEKLHHSPKSEKPKRKLHILKINTDQSATKQRKFKNNLYKTDDDKNSKLIHTNHKENFTLPKITRSRSFETETSFPERTIRRHSDSQNNDGFIIKNKLRNKPQVKSNNINLKLYKNILPRIDTRWTNYPKPIRKDRSRLITSQSSGNPSIKLETIPKPRKYR